MKIRKRRKGWRESKGGKNEEEKRSEGIGEKCKRRTWNKDKER